MLMKWKQKVTNAINPDSIVDQIHSDFDSAAESFLKKAKKFIEDVNNEVHVDRVKMLRETGFSSSVDVRKSEEKDSFDERMKIVMEYIESYPEYRFIFIQDVKDICKKYGLGCLFVDRFKGEIPTENLKQIYRFKKEVVIKKEHVRYRWTGSMFSGSDVYRDDRAVWSITSPVDTMAIVAGRDQFNLSYGDEWEADGSLKVKDPVVLMPVKHGFLIVSKWGKEADYEEFKD